MSALALLTGGLGEGSSFLLTDGLSLGAAPPPPPSGYVATTNVWVQPYPVATLELWVDITGDLGSSPFTFDCTKQLAALGTGFTVSGEPTIEWTGGGQQNNPALTVGAPVLDPTSSKIQVVLSAGLAAAAVGMFRLSAYFQATDGTRTFYLTARGSLLVSQVQ